MKKQSEKYGRLTLIKFVRGRHNERAWLCKCDCGKEKLLSETNIGNSTLSCGCLRSEIARSQKTYFKHGKTKTVEHRAWISMRQRCRDRNFHSYKNYGGRGISICDRWDSFENFLNDIGLRPSPKHSLERINNDGNYEPSNCKWATRLEQTKNRRPRSQWDIGMRGSNAPGAAAARYAIAMLSFGG